MKFVELTVNVQRRIYDQVGDEGVNQHEQHKSSGGAGGGFPGGSFQFGGGGGGSGFDPFMIFEQMFGSRGFPGGSGGNGFHFGGGGGGKRRGGGVPHQGGGGGEDFFAGTEVTSITAANAKQVIGKDIRKKDGRVWTIMFYAPWCKFCRYPHLN